MILRIIMYIASGFLAIYLVNYFNLAFIEYSVLNVLIAAGAILVLRALFGIFTRLLRVLVFAFVFLPLVGFAIYYMYSYFTGQPVELVSW